MVTDFTGFLIFTVVFGTSLGSYNYVLKMYTYQWYVFMFSRGKNGSKEGNEVAGFFIFSQ